MAKKFIEKMRFFFQMRHIDLDDLEVYLNGINELLLDKESKDNVRRKDREIEIRDLYEKLINDEIKEEERGDLLEEARYVVDYHDDWDNEMYSNYHTIKRSFYVGFVVAWCSLIESRLKFLFENILDEKIPQKKDKLSEAAFVMRK
ncbi:MAG TPA: hypothetical protein VGE07_26565, partial [Herpetosiphonaceae bacterium]